MTISSTAKMPIIVFRMRGCYRVKEKQTTNDKSKKGLNVLAKHEFGCISKNKKRSEQMPKPFKILTSF